MELKVGYKNTEIGVIPEDWTLINFDKAFYFLSTASYSRAELSKNAKVKYVHYGDIHTKLEHFLDFKTFELPTINNEQLKTYNLIKEGDLIMADASEDYEGIGKSVEVKNIENVKAISGLHTFLLRGKEGIFSNNFKAYLHSNKIVKTQYDKLATGLKVYGVSKANLKQILIPLPPLPEQTAIATVLSDTDSLIQALEKKIAKKQLIKKRAMQELLTPKEGWDNCQLNDAVDFLDNLRQPIKSGDRIAIRGIYPYYGASGIIDYVNDYIFDDELILLGEDGENILSRNLPLAFKVKGKLWVNNHAHVLKPKSEFAIDFLTAFLESLDYTLLNSGTAQPKLNKQACKKIKIVKPPFTEQTRIAQILSDMDSEIETLQKKLAKYKQLKQGLMQSLLTGKIRLV